jgi:hypothetical protein
MAGNVGPGIEVWRSSASGAIHTGKRQYAETPAQEMIWPVKQKKISQQQKDREMRLCERGERGIRATGISGGRLAVRERSFWRGMPARPDVIR